jgi:hypothetical protein
MVLPTSVTCASRLLTITNVAKRKTAGRNLNLFFIVLSFSIL